MEIFKLLGRIAISGADEAQNEITETTEHAEKKGTKLLGAMAKIGTAAIAAGGAAVLAVGKQALSAYADYEQLVGGVDTLFKESSAKVQEYAANAYKTAGLSANAYMETVTSFSASLLQSLGGDTAAAAEMADLAITDMSDNANKMGTDMAAIQNAYNGFAKQNYTMLDNLKLGYGGTKEEMERLIADANALNAAQGKYTEYSIDSYADIVSAIHDVQTEMGITGTTAKEASTTIQGSISSMKSAWGNLLTGIADENADFDGLMSNFVSSIVTVGKNIIPRINTIIQGITQLVSQASQTIIPLAVQTIFENLPGIVTAGIELISALGQAIIDNLPMLADAAIEIVLQLADSLVNGLPDIINALVQITIAIVSKLTSTEFLTQLIEAGISILLALVNGLIQAIPQLLQQIPIIIANVVSAIIVELPNLITAGIELVFALIDGLIQAIPQLVAAVPQLIIGIVNGIANNLDKIILAAPQIILSLITGIIGAIPELIAAVPRVIAAIADTIRNYNWADIGKNIVQGLKNGIASMWNNIKSWFNEKINGLVGGVKRILGIHSPSKVFAGIGGFMAEGLGEGFDDQFKAVKKDIEGSMNFEDAEASINVFSNARQIKHTMPWTPKAQSDNDKSIHLTVIAPDGRELARFIAPYMGAQLQLVRG